MLSREVLMAKYADELKTDGKIAQGTVFEMDRLVNTPITVQENLFRMLDGKKPMWQPKDIDYVMFDPRIVPDNTARAQTFEFHKLTPEERGGKDMFGITWEYIEQAGGSMVRPGRPAVTDINDWENQVEIPDVFSYDWEGSARENQGFFAEGYPIYVQVVNGLFERLISFMDFENAAIALVDDEQKPGVHRLFRKLVDIYKDLFACYKKYFGVNMICFHDDWGGQYAPFFSVDTCREMILPYLKQIFEEAHRLGMYVDFHSCGKHENLTPVMIEAGADMWYPQPMNDLDSLYETYGKDIIFGFMLDAKDDSEDAAWDLAVNFMEKYGKNYNTMPYIGKGTNPIFYQYLYVLSREAYAQ